MVLYVKIKIINITVKSTGFYLHSESKTFFEKTILNALEYDFYYFISH